MSIKYMCFKQEECLWYETLNEKRADPETSVAESELSGKFLLISPSFTVDPNVQDMQVRSHSLPCNRHGPLNVKLLLRPDLCLVL